MKLSLSLLALASSLYGYTYTGCGENKKDALFELSGNIKSSIENNFEQTIQTNNNEDDVQTKISSYISASTNLSLVNIVYKRKNPNEVCASVTKEDQAKNTKKMLETALLYKEENLPINIDKKAQKLNLWLKDIEQLRYLLPVFMDDTQEAQKILNKKEKLFNDLYSQALAHSESLVWRSCAKNKEDAKAALNTKLFKNQTKKEIEGFFASIASVFSSDKSPMIDLFKEQLNYIKKRDQECAVIKKDELLNIAQSMNADVARFNKSILEENPKKRYKQIHNYLEHLNVTKALIELYPETFKNNDFSRISNTKEMLSEILKTTYPQNVIFHVKGKQGISIKLDGKIVQNNQNYYIPHGEHSYTITTKDKCPISGTFSLDLEDEEKISEDFSSNNYPTVLFITDKTPNIVVNGQIVKPNTITPIKECNADVRYVVKFAGQNRDGELSLSPGKAHQIELNFLTKKELEVFNDAKTKYFTTTSGAKFSESLTLVSGENLEFILEDDVTNGELKLHEKGSFRYKSNDGFVGTDSFEFVIKANGKTSAPKVVNITVNASTTVVKIAKVVADINETVEDTKVIVQETIDEAEEKYQRFKIYVTSQELDVEKMKKLKETYPKMFSRLVQEMTGN